MNTIELEKAAEEYANDPDDNITSHGYEYDGFLEDESEWENYKQAFIAGAYWANDQK